MLALIPVRDGMFPAGAAEVVAECAGRAMLAGSGLAGAPLAELSGEGAGLDLSLVELGTFEPARWAEQLGRVLADAAAGTTVVLPASPDGRDLAPRLAHRLGRVLLTNAVSVAAGRVVVSRAGLQLHAFDVDEPVIVTFQPGVRGAAPAPAEPVSVRPVTDPAMTDVSRPAAAGPLGAAHEPTDATVVAVHPPDVTTMDLAEAPRILGGGAGLDGADRLQQLATVAAAIGASIGGTRVVTDRGWLAHERQIGTTGVVVDPELYLAFGVSGAVQHTSGLGDPAHIVSVNTDPYCPMMQLADLAVVADANAVVDELERLLVGRDRA
jgi:electron transfer flavoprotein alpha subunit